MKNAHTQKCEVQILDKLKIIVLTQQDRFFIPQNIEKLLAVGNVTKIVNVNCKSSLNTRLADFLKWFGWRQTIKMSMAYGIRIVMGIIDSFTSYKLFKGYCSIKHIAKKHGISYEEINQTNEPSFFKKVKSDSPDLIVSYSAPQVIKEPLLSYPPKGIINVHGSLLPDYRGCLPSFWYLFNNEEFAGATVHYMSAKIDDGAIVLQDSVSIKECKSMFDVMKRTKELGGELMVKAVQNINNNVVETKPNLTEQGRYFTWPTKEQGRQLLRSGKRLI